MIGFIRWDGRSRGKCRTHDDAVPMTKAETIMRREEAIAQYQCELDENIEALSDLIMDDIWDPARLANCNSKGLYESELLCGGPHE